MITGKNNAPALYINGQKWKQQNEQRISVADRLLVAIGNKKGLTANDRLLLIVLIGQTDDPTRPFHPSEKWIRDRTGMSHDTYIERRKSLATKGIIEFKEYESITINLEALEN